jgi:hypothetical protein
MSRKIRWSLRILGWFLVVASLAPRRSTSELGPGAESTLVLGFAASPLYVRDSTVIHAGVANLEQEEVVESHSNFRIASWSMLSLIVGALFVTASNRKAARS